MLKNNEATVKDGIGAELIKIDPKKPMTQAFVYADLER